MLDRLNNSEMEERNRSTGGMVLTESNMEYRIWYNWRTRLSLFITAISCNILIYSKNACNASGIFLQIRCYFMRINIDRICYWASLHSNSKKDLGTSAKIFIKTSWSNLRRVPVLAPRYVLADEVAFNNESRQNPSPGSRIPTNRSTTRDEGRTPAHESFNIKKIPKPVVFHHYSFQRLHCSRDQSVRELMRKPSRSSWLLDQLL